MSLWQCRTLCGKLVKSQRVLYGILHLKPLSQQMGNVQLASTTLNYKLGSEVSIHQKNTLGVKLRSRTTIMKSKHFTAGAS